MGLGVSSLAKEVGFEEGDQILLVDGKQLDIALDINKMLLIRGVKEVKVERADGREVTLSIPENIGNRMFESGELSILYPRSPAIVDSVLADKPAGQAGIKSGDKIISANGVTIDDWMDLSKFNNDNANQVVNYIIVNNMSIDTLSMRLDSNGKMGVMPRNVIKLDQVELSLSQSIEEGFSYGYWTLYEYIAQFKYIFTKKGASQLGGFGAIGSLFPSKWDWKGFWSSTALISIILAFMNILPLPALDGGHAMFLMYEIITGRKANDKVLEYAQVIGFIFLITLVIYAKGNDLYRWLYK